MIFFGRELPGHVYEVDVPMGHCFLGDCVGVVLVPRSDNDLHICVQPVVEDDETWHFGTGSFSSYWMPEFVEQVNRAMAWMQTHAQVDRDGYGWEFKESA